MDELARRVDQLAGRVEALAGLIESLCDRVDAMARILPATDHPPVTAEDIADIAARMVRLIDSRLDAQSEGITNALGSRGRALPATTNELLIDLTTKFESELDTRI